MISFCAQGLECQSVRWSDDELRNAIPQLYPDVTTMLRRHCPDPTLVEDVVHTTFLQLLQSQQEGTLHNWGMRALRGWLFRTGVHALFEAISKCSEIDLGVTESIGESDCSEDVNLPFQGRLLRTEDALAVQDVLKIIDTLPTAPREGVYELIRESENEHREKSKAKRSWRFRLHKKILPAFKKGGFVIKSRRSSKKK